MNFLLFISLLSLSNGALLSVFENPKEFVASLTEANPATIRKMKQMVEELIDAGEGERATVIEAHNEASARFDTAVSEQADAAEAKNIAGGEKQTALNEMNRLAGIEATAKAKRDDASNRLAAAESDAANKASIRAAEIIRLDSEKALMEKVLAKLETLLPGTELIEGKLTVVDFIVGRRLLATAAELADRDAVEKIVDKINALVGAGEGERNKAIRDDEKAAAALVKAQEHHDVSVEEHKTAAGKLGSAESEFDRLSKIFRVKCTEKEEADTELASSTDDLAKKKATREEEETRINSEKATLEEVDTLLDALLESSE